MERNARRRRENKSLSDKIILYSGIAVAILAVIVFGLLMYSKSISDDVQNSTMSLEQMANIANNSKTNNTDTESASTEIGKSVEEAKNETSENTSNATNKARTTTSINTSNISTTNSSVNSSSISTENRNIVNNANNQAQSTQTNSNTNKNEPKEWIFAKPVEGDIVREFAKDNLIYSATLEEWTTHMGIDIKAEKTTVVNAAEAGTIKSIKNDPRYGLTIVIEHDEHYQTVYSNLLSSEFVVEGEKVEKGQAIGTIGNTAVFEIADEPHLHFEILKDSLPVDPGIYNIK